MHGSIGMGYTMSEKTFAKYQKNGIYSIKTAIIKTKKHGNVLSASFPFATVAIAFQKMPSLIPFSTRVMLGLPSSKESMRLKPSKPS
jgi:hypothetical protein